ncbi:hypothetical protein IM793_05860 [Pedobacter sp. MR2016-19]|uniref:hypothetical protein n=1 Tax=Pedobacter sp. MR2016-19 TaxID=2780089 RepID=UPI001875D947|nr:hypothetical protein [Pedobacter sp. MR2016-19]MBE5318670.1 hypothetical protein [Pedobacter sp. MR2016-19]
MIQFVKYLSDLISTNGIVQYVYSTDESQSMLGLICKEGNIHISTVDKENDAMFRNAVAGTKFEFLKGKC